jgi:hypothetical protein
MDKAVQHKIASLIEDINAIARELDDISRGIGTEFKGIGSAKCASSLQNAAEKYRRVGHELRKI